MHVQFRKPIVLLLLPGAPLAPIVAPASPRRGRPRDGPGCPPCYPKTRSSPEANRIAIKERDPANDIDEVRILDLTTGEKNAGTTDMMQDL